MVHTLKKIGICILSVYFFVLAAIFIAQFILNQYGFEYRSCLKTFCVFWTYKLSFWIVALLLYFIFCVQMAKRKEEHEQKNFRIKWTLILVTYIVTGVFLFFVFALGGFLDVPQEEMLETGYLKITEIKGFTEVEYYYCEPTSKYLRRPLTSPSHVINPAYE